MHEIIRLDALNLSKGSRGEESLSHTGWPSYTSLPWWRSSKDGDTSKRACGQHPRSSRDTGRAVPYPLEKYLLASDLDEAAGVTALETPNFGPADRRARKRMRRCLSALHLRLRGDKTIVGPATAPGPRNPPSHLQVLCASSCISIKEVGGGSLRCTLDSPAILAFRVGDPARMER